MSNRIQNIVCDRAEHFLLNLRKLQGFSSPTFGLNDLYYDIIGQIGLNELGFWVSIANTVTKLSYCNQKFRALREKYSARLSELSSTCLEDILGLWINVNMFTPIWKIPEK